MLKFLKTYLKLKKKHELLSFIRSLQHLGRPSQIFFPPELIDQGLGLILSGLNNTLAIQSNLDWVWPFWVERQQNPSAGEFIPTGVNTITINLSHRNWTAIGIRNSSRESMIDPVGMLTMHPFGWSVFPYVRYRGQSWYPPQLSKQTRQFLKDDVLPSVVTEYTVSKKFSWKSETRAIETSGEELIQFSHTLANTTHQPVDLTFGLAIRPYNGLTLGHINTLKFKNNLWRINRKPGFLLLEEPDRYLISDRHSGDPLMLDKQQKSGNSLSSKTGIISGISEFQLTLQPGEKRTIESVGTVSRLTDLPNTKFNSISVQSLAKHDSQFRSEWLENQQRGLSLRIPDESLQTAFDALKNKMHVFDDGEHFSPGTFFYHNHWLRDSAFISLAFMNLGFMDEVKRKISGFASTQTKDGFFKSQNGEWDSNGQVMFSLIQYCRRSGDLETLDRYLPSLMRGHQWIEKMRDGVRNGRAPHSGMLPAGFSAEHFGPNDHYFWDNFWALAGLRELVWATHILGRERDAERIHQAYENYVSDINSVIMNVSRQAGKDQLPTSPYRRMDSASIGNLVAITPLNLYELDEFWVRPTTDYLLQNNMHNDMFFQKIIHTGLNTYLTIQLAKVLVRLNNPYFHTMIRAVLNYGGPTYTWPEAINPLTNGGCMGDGDHGWAAAEMINIIRDLFVQEERDRLILGQGLSPDWICSPKPVSIKHANTVFGTVSYDIQKHDNELTVHWQIQRHSHQSPVPVILRIPLSESLRNRYQTDALTFHLNDDSGEKRINLSDVTNLKGIQHDAYSFF